MHNRTTTRSTVDRFAIARWLSLCWLPGPARAPIWTLTDCSVSLNLDSLPSDEIDAWPLSFGQTITLELAAWRITAEKNYHARAFKLGEIAIEKFFGDSPLPRASLKTDHYENSTGADTLALALAELHLRTRTITAVRAAPNTIDR